MTHTPEIVQRYDVARVPRGFLPYALPVHRFARQTWQARSLVWNFFIRELRGRFHGSAGGVFWVLLQPLFQFAVYFAVFGVLFAPATAATGADRFYAIYLFAGVLLFHALTDCIGSAMRSVVQNGNLVKKVAFPCEVLPLTPVLVSAVTYVVGCGVLLIAGLAFGEVHLGPAVLAWPLLVLCAVVFATGFGMLLAAGNVLARDVQQLYPLFTMAWFFMSPVFWRMNDIKAKVDGMQLSWVMDLFCLNPAYCLLLAQRQVFGIGDGLPAADYAAAFPHGLGSNLLLSAAWAAVMFFIGYGFFMSRKRKFADLV